MAKAKKHTENPGEAPGEKTDPSTMVVRDSILNDTFRISFDASKLPPFNRKQYERLVELRDAMLDTLTGNAKETLRSNEGADGSAFGMHQADAGSDAYDRDFALNLLSKEQDALYEIEEAIKRVEGGAYGTCEISGKPIPKARLEAIPFARYTVECQSQLEKENLAGRSRHQTTSLFGLTDDDDDRDDDMGHDNKD